MRKILLIDDEPKLIEDILMAYGFDIEVALDGYKGIRALYNAKGNFDMIILDLQMPAMDGWSTLKAIRQSEEYAHIPILVLTSSDSEDALVAGLRRGADEYVTKPVTPKKLLAYIEALARRSTWESEDIQKAKVMENEAMASLLTQREQEILRYIVQGFSNQQISKILVISETTVKNHLAHIYKKMNVANRTQAAYMAQKLKLV